MIVTDLEQQVAQIQKQLQQAQLDNNDLTEKLSNADTTTQQHSSAPPVPEIQFTPHLAGVHPPPPLNLDAENTVDTWKLWKQQWNNHMMLSNLRSLDESIQCAMLANCLGPTALKICDILEYNSSETKSVSLILQKLEQTIIG